MSRLLYTVGRMFILLRMRIGGVRWYYSCGRAVLEIGGVPVFTEPELSREVIQAIGEGPPAYDEL